MEPRGVRPRTAVRQSGLRCRLAAATVLALLCLMALAPYASANTADRAATHTFLQASYTLDLAIARNTSAANQIIARTGAAIAAECPKVLAGAPGGPEGSASAGGGKQLSPRAQGEADRQQHQFSALTDELETTLRVDAFSVDEQAFAAFVATVTPLRWTDPAIAPAVQEDVAVVRSIFEPGPPLAVCADMRFWVSSGYRALSAATRTFEASREGLFGSFGLLGTVSPEQAIKRYEGPSERALVRRTEKLKTADIFETGGTQGAKLHEALGIKEAEAQTSLPKRTVIGHGRTHSGIKFEVEVSPGFGRSCPHIVSFSYTLTSPEGSFSSSTSSSLRCLSGGAKPAAHAEVACTEAGISVESSTLPQTRRVSLRSSDGQTIVSSVVPVAKRYGGPAGAYFQAVRGPRPYPVSLTELDAAGNALRTVALRHVRGCKPVTHSGTGRALTRQLAKGSTPAGGTFTITAIALDDRGHRTLNLEAAGIGSQGATAESLPASLGPGVAAKYFDWQLSVGCQTQMLSLLFGRLKPPAASVLVATATTPLTPLTQVALPAALHEPGFLAYSLLDGLPTELVIKSASGATLVKEDLAARAKREAEYCEGYAEPPG